MAVTACLKRRYQSLNSDVTIGYFIVIKLHLPGKCFRDTLINVTLDARSCSTHGKPITPKLNNFWHSS